jgi:HSF-type DNA-binding
VHKPEAFVDKVMKNHFQQTKYKSFQRQLNLWGFERNNKESIERGSYRHPLFIKGRKDLCQEMGRQKSNCPTSTEAPPKKKTTEEQSSLPVLSGRVTPSLQSSPGPSIARSNDLSALASLYNYGAGNSNQSQMLSQVMSAAIMAQKRQEERQQQQQSQIANLHALLQGNHDPMRASQLASMLWRHPATGSQPTHSNSVVDALRLKGASAAPPNIVDSMDIMRQFLLVGNNQSHQRQPLPQFLPTSSNTTPLGSSSAGETLAKADADIIQALKRRAAIEQLLRGTQQMDVHNTGEPGSLAKILSSLS